MKEQSSSGKFPGMPAFYIIFLQEQQLAVVKDHRLDTESHQDIPFLRHTITPYPYFAYSLKFSITFNYIIPRQ